MFFMVVQHRSRSLHDEISNECQKMKRNSGFMNRPNQFNYLLHICFDSLSRAELNASLSFAQQTTFAILLLRCGERMWLIE